MKVAGIAAVLLIGAGGVAHAQEQEESAAPTETTETTDTTVTTAPAPAPAAAAEPSDDAVVATDVDPVAKQEIGVRLGAQVGFPSLGHGGFRLGGVYLYRLSDNTWFDGEAAAAFGSDDRECYYSRAESLSLVCDHAGFEGFGISAAGGIRVFLPPRASGFHPYIRAGVDLSWEGFSSDEVNGVGLYLHGGAGGRFRVSPRVAVGGEALLLVGPGLYNSDLGVRLLGGLVVQLGVEFAL